MTGVPLPAAYGCEVRGDAKTSPCDACSCSSGWVVRPRAARRSRIRVSTISIRRSAFSSSSATPQRTSNWEFWRERNFEETQQLLAEIARRNLEAWIVYAGDLTVRGSSQDHWEDFVAAWQKPILEKKIPCFPVFGNHEYYGDNETACAAALLQAGFRRSRSECGTASGSRCVGVIRFRSNASNEA
ncbi:MAG: metallophosphoesterase [Desulfobacterales bacterium]|nr:metallophosphoesterase [Desulfobacterales bacterium]